MNKANLKSYAPKARLDFIKTVTERANVLGISAAGTVPAQLRGDVAIIDGREWPAQVAGQRDELISRIKRHGFEQTMDEVAYTWFNRFAALRYMEIHDYLGHGWRVLSSRDGGLPEILRHASEVTLPGLNADRAREMQLAGNRDNELYKLLLVAQCNELSRVMPFLFERIDDETELLLPENLLRTDSIVAKLVESVPEEDWQEIEAIGWLYQFYITDEKERVDRKVKSGGSVESQEIPAKTQLFTPNWIVQYLVQNSVGRLWLMANPSSTLANQWPYYIRPAEQTLGVQAQLDALIQARIREDGETLNPETITVVDPACGSGHILVVAYDVMKAIYLERGYQLRAIPRLILEKNLYGLDIDDRAAQLAAFALLMKARSDDRRLFADPPKLNVMSLKASKGLELDEVARSLAPFGLQRALLKELLDTFAHSKTFGSLIQIPSNLNARLPAMTDAIQHALRDDDLYAQQAAKGILPLVSQALLLGMQFDAVVANPPYMGGKSMNPRLKDFAGSSFPSAKSDLFAIFIERGFLWCKDTAFNSMVTMQSWMFLSSYEEMRNDILESRTPSCMAHLGNGVMGIAFGTSATIFFSRLMGDYVARYCYCSSDDLNSSGFPKVFPPENKRNVELSAVDLKKIPGAPIAYWASSSIRDIFASSRLIDDIADVRQGLRTGDNEKFLRSWHEIDASKIGFDFESVDAAHKTNYKWFPYNKGGSYRKWYGNNEYVIAFDKVSYGLLGQQGNKLPSRQYYFRPSITWTGISSGDFSARYSPKGFSFDGTGSCLFSRGTPSVEYFGALLNSKIAARFLEIISSTVSFEVGHLKRIPVIETPKNSLELLAKEAIGIAKADWDSFETSWDFESLPLVRKSKLPAELAAVWEDWRKTTRVRISRMQAIEEESNRLSIEAYGLQQELTPEVPESQITLARADREKDCQRLISYIIGCMMGRYSLEEPGLIYANAGNIGFDPGRYGKNVPADVDGIVPLTDERWFEDDAAGRVREFLLAVWGADSLEENIGWLADSLGIKGTETPDEAVRRYLAERFFKEHLQTYSKRPIYWLFSSGKHGAFQALVYLHRYNEGTLARMRAEYLVPLISKVLSRLDMLDKDMAAASSAAARTKLQKQIESLRRKQIELLAYDEKLRHYADMRITLDLDDGVKVNYAKFGDLVAEAKAITGGSDE